MCHYDDVVVGGSGQGHCNMMIHAVLLLVVKFLIAGWNWGHEIGGCGARFRIE